MRKIRRIIRNYQEIWDEKELKEELAKDEDKLLFDKETNDG
ncbi:hypothetical protein [uncultured Fibrobacter sp.]|nr:hypothetical protein [uncultured Fibrobacter sp.]